MSTDYYSILGVSRAASQDEMKRQFKKLAVKFHPDKNKDESAHETFLQISKAYETLKDEKLRQEYDKKLGINNPSIPRYGFPSSFSQYALYATTSRNGTTTTRTQTNFRNASSHFASYFETNMRSYADASKRTYKPPAPDPNQVAEDAKRMMKEHIARKQAEYIRNAQKQKQEEEKRRMEQVLRDFTNSTQSEPPKKEKFRAQSNLWDIETEDIRKGVFGRARTTYDRATHERANGKSNGGFGVPFDPDSGRNSSRPIVVDDDSDSGGSVEDDGDIEDDEDSSDLGSASSASQYEDANTNHYSDNYHESNDSDDLKEVDEQDMDDDKAHESFRDDMAANPPSEGFPNNGDHSFADDVEEYPNTPVSEPDLVEIIADDDDDNELNDLGHKPEKSPEPFASPGGKKRQPQRTPSIQQKPSESRNGAKKPRLSNFDDLRSSLGTNLDDVDFSDFRLTLPGESKVRQASTSEAPESSKRQRVAEYTDGLTRALTLFTPVNNLRKRDPSHLLTVKDLQPKVDPELLIFYNRPPSIKLSSATTQKEWEIYVARTKVYQQEFNTYRKNVLEFQVQRYEIDTKCQNSIYSDVECLQVYLSCLATEQRVMQRYNEAFQMFQQTMHIFRSNCALRDFRQ